MHILHHGKEQQPGSTAHIQQCLESSPSGTKCYHFSCVLTTNKSLQILSSLHNVDSMRKLLAGKSDLKTSTISRLPYLKSIFPYPKNMAGVKRCERWWCKTLREMMKTVLHYDILTHKENTQPATLQLLLLKHFPRIINTCSTRPIRKCLGIYVTRF